MLLMVREARARDDAEWNRRVATRFPIRREVKYKVDRGRSFATGSGSTVNIGSGGVLFTTADQLTFGQRVELSVNWPASLNETCALTFVARGHVIRAELKRAAMRIESYRFRTRAMPASQVATESATVNAVR